MSALPSRGGRVEGWMLLFSAGACLAAVGALVVSALTHRLGSRAEQRATGRCDVSWSIVRDGGVFTVTNSGRDPALDVLLVVSVDHETNRADAESLDPDQSLTVRSALAAELAAAYDAECREQEEAAEQMDRWSALGVSLRPMPMPEFIDVRVQVTWKSPAGRWDSYATERREGA